MQALAARPVIQSYAFGRLALERPARGGMFRRFPAPRREEKSPAGVRDRPSRRDQQYVMGTVLFKAVHRLAV